MELANMLRSLHRNRLSLRSLKIGPEIRITSFDILPEMPNLEILVIRGNHLSSGFEHLLLYPKLKILKIPENQICNIDDCAPILKLKKLEILDMSRNPFSMQEICDYSSFKDNLPVLKRLDGYSVPGNWEETTDEDEDHKVTARARKQRKRRAGDLIWHLSFGNPQTRW